MDRVIWPSCIVGISQVALEIPTIQLGQSSLSKHFIQALYQSTLSKHFIKVLQRYYKGVYQQSGRVVLNMFKNYPALQGITKVLQQGIKTSQ